MSRNSHKKRQRKKEQQRRSKGRSASRPADAMISQDEDAAIELFASFSRGTVECGSMPPPGAAASLDNIFREAPRHLRPLGPLAKQMGTYLVEDGDFPREDLESLQRLAPQFRRAHESKLYDICLAAMSLTNRPDDNEAQIPNLRISAGRLYAGMRVLDAVREGRKVEFPDLRWWSKGHTEAIEALIAAKKFIHLKNPKPTLKTAKQLDEQLASLPLESPTGKALGALLRLVIETKNTTKLKDWKSLTHFHRLVRVVDGKEPPLLWYGARPDNAPNSHERLIRRLMQVDVSGLTFEERIRYQGMLVRLQYEFYDASEPDEVLFHKNLLALTRLLTRGVPPESAGMASAALGHLCDWLASTTASKRDFRLDRPTAETLYKYRPDDYRAAIGHWLAHHGSPNPPVRPPEGGWKQIDFAAFYRGFGISPFQPERFKSLFFDPLSNEGKKNLTLQACRRTFANSVSDDAFSHTWGLIVDRLLLPQEEPVVSILRGRACEAEFLSFVVLAMFTENRLDWMTADHYTTVLRFVTSKVREFRMKPFIDLLVELMPRFPQASRAAVDHLDKLVFDIFESRAVKDKQLGQRLLRACRDVLEKTPGDTLTAVPKRLTETISTHLAKQQQGRRRNQRRKTNKPKPKDFWGTHF